MEIEDGRIAIFASRASEERPWFAACVVFAVLGESTTPLTGFDPPAE
jgi:hypothetical protein